VLSFAFCTWLLDSEEAAALLLAFERRLVPDESLLQVRGRVRVRGRGRCRATANLILTLTLTLTRTRTRTLTLPRYRPR